MSKQWWSGHQDYNHWLEALDSGKGPQLFDIEHFRGSPSDDNLTHGFHVIGVVLTNRKIYFGYSKCNFDVSKYNRKLGYRIAMGRALKSAVHDVLFGYGCDGYVPLKDSKMLEKRDLRDFVRGNAWAWAGEQYALTAHGTQCRNESLPGSSIIEIEELGKKFVQDSDSYISELLDSYKDDIYDPFHESAIC